MERHGGFLRTSSLLFFIREPGLHDPTVDVWNFQCPKYLLCGPIVRGTPLRLGPRLGPRGRESSNTSEPVPDVKRLSSSEGFRRPYDVGPTRHRLPG